jgi:archaellum component FlaF (FlaF/FlaG flagellin family)
MKKFIVMLLCTAVCCGTAAAQNCSQFVNSVNGKKLTYINQDAKGNLQMTAVYTSAKKDASTISTHAEITDKNGKLMGTGDSEMICDGNAIKVDMKSFIPASSMKQYSDMKISGEAKYLTYPTNMQAGQTLDDGSVTIEMNGNGSPMTLQMDIVNRKVEQAETISTNAGSFDCFKITYEATTKVKIAGIGIPFHMKITEWYAPKLGRFVKSETYTKGGKLMGVMVLDAIK